MDKLKEIDLKIQHIANMLDQVAGESVSPDIASRPVDIEYIGEALAALCEVRMSIYLQRPDLRPEYLKDLNQDREHNHTLGRLLLLNKRLLTDDKAREAINGLKAFIAQHPPKEYRDIANSEINRIEDEYKSKKA